MFYALTVTFAGIDWIMSLNPHWYSTLFGFLMMGGQGLSALAFTIIVVDVPRASASRWQALLKPNHFHDLGKLMFAFVMLWAYFNFSQFLLTYAANLVEEIPYLIARIEPRLAVPGALPGALPLRRAVAAAAVARPKRTPHRLVIDRGWILFVRYVDLYMLVSPEFASSGENLHLLAGEHASHFFVHWLDLAAPLAIGGLWLWMFFTQLRAAAAAGVRRSVPARGARKRRRPLMAHHPMHAGHALGRRRVPRHAAGLRATSTPTPTSGSIVKFAVLARDLGGRHPRRPGLHVRAADRGPAARGDRERRFPLAAAQEPRLPPAPRLQQFPANELYEFRAAKRPLLDGYGWVNKEAGTVHIPIAEAMRLTVERGLPVARARTRRDADDAGHDAVPTRAPGATMERRRQ